MEVSESWVVLLSLTILATLILLAAVFWYTWKTFRQTAGVSPYTGMPLRKATDLPYFSVERTFTYLNSYHQFDNRIFLLRRSTFCRETGRIFQNTISWLGIAQVDWSFLVKRYPGDYVSWGSLTPEQQRYIRQSHDSLEGYQTEISSPFPSPREITPEYIYTKPGPLYVDFNRKILLGWKIVPGTNLEVLIVQKPVK